MTQILFYQLLLQGLRSRKLEILLSYTLCLQDLLSSAFGGGLDNLQELQLSRKVGTAVRAVVQGQATPDQHCNSIPRTGVRGCARSCLCTQCGQP